MKTITTIFLLLCLLMISCDGDPKGTVYPSEINNDNLNLPPELKGLKVYGVKLSALNYIYVGVLDNQVNSLGYAEGKTHEYVIMVNDNRGKEKVIRARYIISENDSIIVLKK